MGVNVCKSAFCCASTAAAKDVAQKNMYQPKDFGKNCGIVISVCSLPPLPSQCSEAAPLENEQGVGRVVFPSSPIYSETTKFSLSEKKPTFETQLPLFVNIGVCKNCNNGQTYDQTLEKISIRSYDNNDDCSNLERPHSGLAYCVGGEGCSSALGVSFTETKNRKHTALPHYWETTKPRLHRTRSAVDFSLASVSQAVSGRGGRQESLASDASSNVDSVLNSVISESPFVRSFKGCHDNTRTLENAKAALLKHANMPVMTSLRSGEFSRCSSMGYFPSNENDVSVLRGVNTLGGCSASLAHSNNPGLTCDGACDHRGCHEATLAGQQLLKRTRSFCSGCFSNTNSLGRRKNLSAGRFSFLDLADKSVNSVSGKAQLGGVENASDESTRQSRQMRSGRYGRQLCGFVPTSPRPCDDVDAAAKNKIGTPGSGEQRRNFSVAGSASPTSSGWVAIGADPGVGSKEWYARLRERCDKEDMSESV